MARKRILLVTQNLDDMIKDDLELLNKHYDTDYILFKSGTEAISKLPELIRKIKQCDLCFVWFATYYALFATAFAKMLGKPSVLVVGGYDVVKVPEINYGLITNPVKKIFPIFSLQWADAILPFSDDSKNQMLEYFDVEEKKIRTVYLGVNPVALGKAPGRKANMAATVGVVTKGNLTRKGLEVFVKAAKYLPAVSFVLIGDTPDERAIGYLKEIATPNVHFKNLGYDTKKVVAELSKAKAYVQVSYHEGFGRAMAEAMCQECVPVVSYRGAIPEVVGNTGFYVNNLGSAREVSEKISLALKSKKGKSARKKASAFTLAKREKALVEVMDGLLEKYSEPWVKKR